MTGILSFVLLSRPRIKEDNWKSEKRSNKNSYETKVNVIEDSKRKASTSKDLRRKKTAQGYKGKDQEGKNKRFKGTCYIWRMNVVVVPKRARRPIHRQT